MQYPPQQQPPTHSPSEVYAPQYPSAMPGQEIVIYFNRTQAIVRTIISGIGLVLGIIILLGAIAFIYILGATFHTDYIVPVIIYLAFILPAIAFNGWTTWRMAQFFLKPTPLLIINRQGITVGKIPMFSGFFIPWYEIEAIHAYTFMNKYLCIRPKDTRQFLKRFNALERFNRRSNAIFGIPPLVVPQIFMERSVEETLQQLQFFYAHELNTHHIRLYP
jgi:hypothetical protein